MRQILFLEPVRLRQTTNCRSKLGLFSVTFANHLFSFQVPYKVGPRKTSYRVVTSLIGMK